MKIIKLILFLAILLLQLETGAQSNYLPGHIITLDGETIKGEVDYQNWKRTPSQITFKNGTKETVYRPLDIREFTLQSERYVGAVVTVETSPFKTGDLKHSEKKLNFRQDTTFVQILLHGNKPLYFYRTPELKNQFYISRGDSLELLVYKEYIKKQGIRKRASSRLLMAIKQYRGQLVNHLNDCPTILSDMEATAYEKESLITLFKKYHKCIGLPATVYKRTKKTNHFIGLLAGMSSTKLQFSGISELAKEDFDVSTKPAFGLYVEFGLANHLRRWSFYSELLTTRYSAKNYVEDNIDVDIYNHVTTKIAFTHFKLVTMMRFNYSVGDLVLFASGGFSNGFITKSTNVKLTETRFIGFMSNYEEKVVNPLKRYELGGLLGIGVKWRSFSLESRFEGGNGISNTSDINSSTQRLYVLLGVHF